MEMWKSLCSASLRAAIPTFPQPCQRLFLSLERTPETWYRTHDFGIRASVRFRRGSTVTSAFEATRPGNLIVAEHSAPVRHASGT